MTLRPSVRPSGLPTELFRVLGVVFLNTFSLPSRRVGKKCTPDSQYRFRSSITNHQEPKIISKQSTNKHHPKQDCLPHHTIPLTRPDFPLANRTGTAPWERRRERGKKEGGRFFAHPKMISEEARDLAAAKATIFLIAPGQHHSER